MNAPVRQIDPTTREAQSTASNPAHSAWVSANAGSGKTHVLALRVIRLLLAGADPARLLCLTFTKAAAAEMANRVFDRLAKWPRLDDAKLAAELEDLEGVRPDTAKMARARRLFALALETPGGLKIQTVHAFCERLLHQFPFEAGVAGHFQVLEETAASVLIRDARRRVLGQASANLSSPLGEALQTVVLAASDRSHEDAIAELMEDRAAFERWLERAGSLDTALVELRAALGVETATSRADVEATIVGEKPFSDEELARIVAELRRTGGTQDGKAADRLEPYFHAGGRDGRISAYRDFFCTASGSIRKSLVTKKVLVAWPELEERLADECRRLDALFETANAAESYEVTAAILRLAEAVLASYQWAKAARGLLDFDDLVAKTLELLSRSDAAGWVHYKIDQGIDHILVDEAQDTSPDQWRVVRALADEFFAGEGATERTRTLFAVGDEKQSIYSFQGAVPAWFSRVKRDVAARAAAAGQAFGDVALKVSFRSTPDIVGAVDKIFTPVPAHTGLASEIEPPVHESIRRGEPGMVVLWPMEEPPTEPEPGAWADPLDHLGSAAPEMVLAKRIAATIAEWLDPLDPARLEATGKRIEPGEILILTRRRGPLSEAINRSLKSSGLPVAGADRIALADHIAAKDLIAVADVALQERDDLSLATVLRSPLFGLSDEPLFALAYDRGNRPLWSALREARDAEPFATPFKTLNWLRGRADMVGPFEFFAELLGPGGGRRKFAERLGAEADDLLDEFLAQALAYERLETPSLQGFLAWMRSTATEIRRETDTTQNEIRVMTVHGAKGLEADIVFLVDDGAPPAMPVHDPNFIALADDPDAAEPAPLVWARGTSKKPAAVKALVDARRERSREEYRRLLYVAATRARDRLIVCGTRKEGGAGTDPAGGWHGLISAALKDEATETKAVDGTPAFVWRQVVSGVVQAEAKRELTEAQSPTPPWLSRKVPPARSRRHLTPSRLFQPPPNISARSAFAARREGADALLRGRLVHRLLESLPEHEESNRRDAAERYLEAVAPEMEEAAREGMITEVLAILADPSFAAVFAPGSRAEIDIGAEFDLGEEGVAGLSGRIDRLAVTDHEVLIVDYKTNRQAPESVSEVPAAHIGQLALYRRALAELYADRPVRAALLWTDIPLLMPIPAEMLDKSAGKLLDAATSEGLASDMAGPASA